MNLTADFMNLLTPQLLNSLGSLTGSGNLLGVSQTGQNMGISQLAQNTGVQQVAEQRTKGGSFNKILQNPMLTDAMLKMGATILQNNGNGMTGAQAIGAGLGAFGDSMAQSRALAAQKKQAEQAMLLKMEGERRAQQEMEMKQRAQQRQEQNALVLPDGTTNNQFLQAKAQLAKAGATQIQNNVSPMIGKGENAFVKKRGEDFASDLTNIEETAFKAAQTLPRLQKMRESLEAGMETGAAQEFLTTAKSWAQSAGFDMNGLDEQQVFNAFVQQNIIPQAKQLGVNPTDRDAQRLEDASQSLGKSEEANLVLADYQERMAQTSIGLSQMLGQMEEEGASTYDMKQARRKYLLDNPVRVMSMNEARAKVASGKTGYAQITSEEEYNKLPSGTRFVDPEGKVRIKP